MVGPCELKLVKRSMHLSWDLKGGGHDFILWWFLSLKLSGKLGVKLGVFGVSLPFKGRGTHFASVQDPRESKPVQKSRAITRDFCIDLASREAKFTSVKSRGLFLQGISSIHVCLRSVFRDSIFWASFLFLLKFFSPPPLHVWWRRFAVAPSCIVGVSWSFCWRIFSVLG